MKCSKCGNLINPGTNTCQYCHTPIVSIPPKNNSNPQPTPPGYQTNNNSMNHANPGQPMPVSSLSSNNITAIPQTNIPANQVPRNIATPTSPVNQTIKTPVPPKTIIPTSMSAHQTNNNSLNHANPGQPMPVSSLSSKSITAIPQTNIQANQVPRNIATSTNPVNQTIKTPVPPKTIIPTSMSAHQTNNNFISQSNNTGTSTVVSPPSTKVAADSTINNPLSSIPNFGQNINAQALPADIQFPSASESADPKQIPSEQTVQEPLATNQTINQSEENIPLQSNSSVSLPASANESSEELVSAYIGKQASKIINSKFSWCSLFFGGTYYCYRKMWLIGFLLWLINPMLITFFNLIGLILVVILQLVSALLFKKLYLNHVHKKISQIKTENPEKSFPELLNICQKKGGTSIIPIIITIISSIIFTILLILIILATHSANTTINNAKVQALEIDANTTANWFDKQYQIYLAGLEIDENFMKTCINNKCYSLDGLTASALDENVLEATGITNTAIKTGTPRSFIIRQINNIDSYVAINTTTQKSCVKLSTASVSKNNSDLIVCSNNCTEQQCISNVSK